MRNGFFEIAGSFDEVDDQLDTFAGFHVDTDVFVAGVEVAKAGCAAVILAADFDDGTGYGGHEFFQVGKLIGVAHGKAFGRIAAECSTK